MNEREHMRTWWNHSALFLLLLSQDWTVGRHNLQLLNGYRTSISDSDFTLSWNEEVPERYLRQQEASQGL